MGWVEPTGPARSGRPDDRLRETHQLQLCYARAVTNYRRNFICGGSFFFAANLAERRFHLLVDDIDLLRQAFRHVRRRHPFDIEAIAVLPDHPHAIWTLPEGDADFALRWRLIKSVFSRGVHTPAKAAELMPSLERFHSAAGKQQQGRSL